MKFCTHCGKEIMDEAIICPNCGCGTGKNSVPSEDDNISVGLCILAYFLPLFGFIYWPLKHRECPKRAKACGITAIVSAALSIVGSIIYSVVLVGMLGSLL